jgi:hypothetical protein
MSDYHPIKPAEVKLSLDICVKFFNELFNPEVAQDPRIEQVCCYSSDDKDDGEFSPQIYLTISLLRLNKDTNKLSNLRESVKFMVNTRKQVTSMDILPSEYLKTGAGFV